MSSTNTSWFLAGRLFEYTVNSTLPDALEPLLAAPNLTSPELYTSELALIGLIVMFLVVVVAPLFALILIT